MNAQPDPVAEGVAAAKARTKRNEEAARRSRLFGSVSFGLVAALGPVAIGLVWIKRPDLAFGDEFFSATAQVAAALFIAALVEGGLTYVRAARLEEKSREKSRRASEEIAIAGSALERASRGVEEAQVELDKATAAGKKKVVKRWTSELKCREDHQAACGARVGRSEFAQASLRVEASEREREQLAIYSLIGLNLLWLVLAEAASLFALLHGGDSLLWFITTFGIWLSATTIGAFVASRFGFFNGWLF
jgi:hypothetical protein